MKQKCMFFSGHPAEGQQPNVHVNGERLDVVEQFKYLGVVFDSNLTFRQHIKKITSVIKFNPANFCYIGPILTLLSAKCVQ